MTAKKLKPGSWAKEAGVPTSTVYSFQRGQSDSFGPGTLAKLADAADVSVPELVAALEEGKLPIARSSDSVATLAIPDGFRMVGIVGSVEAGVWREALQWDEEDVRRFTVPVPPAFSNMNIFGLEVRGPSMNELYPNKTVVFCVRFLDLQREPRSGERVVVYRRTAGELMEATLKEFIVDDKGHKWLRPRSTAPEFQKAWRVHEGAKDEHEFEVHALVIGSYRPEA